MSFNAGHMEALPILATGCARKLLATTILLAPMRELDGLKLLRNLDESAAPLVGPMHGLLLTHNIRGARVVTISSLFSGFGRSALDDPCGTTPAVNPSCRVA